MKYPPDWVATPATPGYGDSFDDRGSMFVFVDRDVVSAGSVAALERTAKAEIAYYKSHYDAKVLSNKKAKVAGWNGRLIKMTATSTAWRPTSSCCCWPRVEWATSLDWSSEDDDREADKALFERMYKSFKPKS